MISRKGNSGTRGIMVGIPMKLHLQIFAKYRSKEEPQKTNDTS